MRGQSWVLVQIRASVNVKTEPCSAQTERMTLSVRHEALVVCYDWCFEAGLCNVFLLLTVMSCVWWSRWKFRRRRLWWARQMLWSKLLMWESTPYVIAFKKSNFERDNTLQNHSSLYSNTTVMKSIKKVTSCVIMTQIVLYCNLTEILVLNICFKRSGWWPGHVS